MQTSVVDLIHVHLSQSIIVINAYLPEVESILQFINIFNISDIWIITQQICYQIC